MEKRKWEKWIQMNYGKNKGIGKMDKNEKIRK